MISDVLGNKLKLTFWLHGSMGKKCDFVQAQQRAAKKWKDRDKKTRELLLCAISTMLKEECCSSAAHSMDEIDLVGFSMYKGLPGLDCTLKGYVLL